MDRPLVIGIGGYTSDVGKTTLMCELLAAFPGWEAIKTTRGHYRSCGKDPHACCVSHLLAAQPSVLPEPVGFGTLPTRVPSFFRCPTVQFDEQLSDELTQTSPFGATARP